MMLDVLLYISLIAGLLLIVLMIISFIGGDLEIGDTDVSVDTDGDADAGGIGWFKGGLTFISTFAFTWRAFLMINANPFMSFTIAAVVGSASFFVLSMLVRSLLKLQQDNTWHYDSLVGKRGSCYLQIPANGFGEVSLEVNGSHKQFKATSADSILTGEPISVLDNEGDDYLIVRKLIN